MNKNKKNGVKIIFLLIAMILVLVGCSGTDGSNDDRDNQNLKLEDDNGDQISDEEAEAGKEVVYLEDNELPYIYSDASTYIGKYVKFIGQVFTEPERDGEYVYLQVYQKPESLENNTIIAYEGNLDVKDGDYLHVDGVIQDEVEGENFFGATVTAPLVMANNLEILSYQDAVSPTIKEITINETQEQHGYEVVLEKIELAESETRVYLTINNNGSSSFSAYSFNSQLLQGQNQFEEESNWDADYPEIQTDLRVGASTSGIMCFPAIDHSEKFTLYIDGYSDDYDEDFEEYTFEIEND